MRLRAPEGLRARLILLLLGALAAAQAASFALFLDERGLAVRMAAGEEAGARALALADAIDAAPASARRALVAESRSHGLRFSLADAPLAADPAATPLPRLAAGIGGTDRTVRAALLDGGARPQRRDSNDDSRREDGHDDEDDDDDRRRERGDRLLISVALADGGWLNAEARLRRPPLQWGRPALISTLFAAAAIAAVVWITVGRIARPMGALAAAADGLGRGERPAPLPLAGPAEMRRATVAFNAMAERLTRLLDERARTLAAIGHDLRSPITAMRIRIEMVDDDETRERLTASVDEIQTLVEGALALARGAGAEEPAETLDVAALLVGLAAELRETGARVAAPDAASAPVRGRPVALKRAFRNIAENAARYGGEARIGVETSPGGVRVTVDDSGPGVPAAERARVFEPFVRLEASRSRDTGGAGLGLAIARAVIEGHGGSVTLSDAPGGGARVTVSLPAAG